MAGLRDEVELDVSAALRDIDRLGAALTQQTQKFTRDLAKGIDTLRTPKLDTTGIDRARASTRGLASDVDKVTRATKGATAATDKYGTVLQSVAQIRVVQGLVAFFGGRALVDQITKTSKAYADLLQETSRSEQVFGDANRAVLGFAEDAVSTIGLARREAIQASNEFGTMFRDAGLAGDQAAALSTEFVALGADLAAFANIGVPEALTKLSSGLAGEIEPLRRIGFAIGQTATEAKALTLGMEKVNGAFTQGQLTQARAAIILDKLRIVSGQFAKEQDGLIGQQATLRAEAEQLREELGEQLAPAMLDLVRAARENLPAFGDLASNTIPLLVSAMGVLNPTLQVLLELLRAFSPILTLVATVLDAIPAPVLQMAGAFLLVNRLTGPLSSGVQTLALRFLYLGDSVKGLTAKGGLASAFAGFNPYVLGATLALGGLVAMLQKHRAEQEKNKRAIQEATQAFLDQADAVDVDATKIAEGILKDGSIGPDLLGRLVNDLGLDLEEFVALAAKGAQGYVELLEIIRGADLGRSDQVFAEREFGEALRTTTQRLQEAAQAALNTAVARGALSKEQVDAAVATNKFADIGEDSMFRVLEGTTNYFAALQELDPALAAAVAGQEDLGGATQETTSAMEALDDALSAVKDALDATFGRFLDAEEATIRLRGSARELAEALGEGAREGESMVDFQERLRSSTLDVARAVENRALAMARAGQIEATQAGITAEMRRQFEELVALFPELAGQLSGYIGLLENVPAEVTTDVNLNLSYAEAQARDWGNRLRSGSIWGGSWRGSGEQAGTDAAAGLADGLSADLEGIAEAGREAGRAAAEAAVDEIETTLRRSAATGLNLGGFIVDGITLGARQAQIDLTNFVNGMTQGLTGVVNDAMKIDQAEASEILAAVARMDQAARDLAEAREKLGADSIEAKLAELELADAQSAVNDALAEAIDSTEAYQEALDKVTDSIDTMTGSLRALQGVRDAQKAAEEAAEGAADAAARVGMFDRLIAETEARLRDARSSGDTLGASRLEDALRDLRNRRGDAAEAAVDAEYALRDAQLDVIDTQQQLVDLGGKVGEAQGVWEGYFRALAEQAGFTKEQVDALVDSLNTAGSAAQAIRQGVLTGSPQAVNFGAFAPPVAPTVGSITGAGATVKTYNVNIYETTSARATAVETVDELRAVELVG